MASSFTNTNKYNHDVFLSFRGADTRYTFTGHLHRALFDKGIHVFIDNELERGEEITRQLLRVIKESRISIVVLSRNYASSSFCLDELVKILECRESERQIVIPVFYQVDPTDVEEQRGTFGQEFAKLKAEFDKPKIVEDFNYWKFIPATDRFLRWMRNTQNEGATTDIERVQNWRLALSVVATLSGYHLKEGDHEANTIRDIVNKVSRRLYHVINLHVGENLVGLDRRVENIHQELEIESDDTCMIGLHGMGGIGKTTIAKALYNKLAGEIEFDGFCFLPNVRENSKKQGVAQLQEKLLREILRDQSHQIGNSDKGIEVMKHRLSCKKVLILIDDVDDIEQLKKLAGEKEWFGGGSKIIITTRDLRFLTLHGVTRVYEVENLKDYEALEVFSWHAFKKPRPEEDYLELSRSIIKHAQGLPLALKVFGSDLYNRNIPLWEEMLKKLKRYPHNDIAKKLEISYYGLETEEKTIFLDIAFFFKGKNRDEVTKFLKACGINALLSVERLIEKSLIHVEGERLEMHDLLQTMATQIEQDKSSRLWIQKQEDLITFNDKSGNDVEILVLDLYGEEEDVPLKWLQNLTKLRALAIRNGRFIKMPKKLPNSIRWLEWHNSSLKSISSEFLPPNLVVLEMPCSNANKFSAHISKAQKFMNLTRMNFSECKHLREMVDFSSIPNLEVLDLRECVKLKKIHKSVGSLKKLEKLNLGRCFSLTSLPNLAENECLECINLGDCSKLENLPNLPTSITQLGLENSGIKEIPSFIGNLINLKSIFASNCRNLVCVSNSFYKLLPSLFTIQLRNCSNLSQLPEAASSMVSSDPQLSDDESSMDFHHTSSLDLSGNKFVSLPVNTFKFIGITALSLNDCEWLVEIPELPPTLDYLKARNCRSLVRFSQFQFESFTGDFSNCHKISKNEKQSWREMVENVSTMRREEDNRWTTYSIVVPGNEIPEWFSYAFSSDGNPPSFKVSSSLLNDFLIGIACCAIFQAPISSRSFDIKFSICDFTVESFDMLFTIDSFDMLSPQESEHMWLAFTSLDFESDFYLPQLLEKEGFMCVFDCQNEEVVLKRVGVHFIYKN